MPAERQHNILEVKGINKRFCHNIPAKRRQLIRQFSMAMLGKPDDSEALAPGEFWALDNVSFSLKRGEALGLIGLNGAGKSTLLSIIARQLLPDRGVVRSRGQIAAMINLTAGFEESLTGRENIFLKGALLGRSRAQVLQKFDEIVEFAEIGDFLDSPVATYSSGMRMRLAFSIAVHTDPDLLLIDEVLSVGDFRFRQKCLRKLNELRSHASFIFVSHSFQDIARFCTRLIVLDKGNLVFDGSTQEGIKFYIGNKAGGDGRHPISADSSSLSIGSAPIALMEPFIDQQAAITSVSFRWFSPDGNPISTVRQGREIKAELRFKPLGGADRVAIGLPIWSMDGVMVTSVNSDTSEIEIESNAEGWVVLQMQFDSLDLNPGTYFPVLSIGKNTELIYRQPVAPLQVSESYSMTWGVFTPRVRWTQCGEEVSAVLSAED